MAFAKKRKASFVDEISIKVEPIEECLTSIQDHTLGVYGSIKQENPDESDSYLKECILIRASTEELGVYGSIRSIKQEQNPDESDSCLKESISISASTEELGVYGSIKQEQNPDESDSYLKECISISASTEEYPEVKLEPQYPDVKLEPQSPGRETSHEDLSPDCSSPTIAVLPNGLEQTKKFSCHICGAEFICVDSLKSHMHAHVRKKMFSCDSCDVKFTHPTSLTRHVRTHTDRKSSENHQCLICLKKLSCRSSLNKHMTSQHENVERYSCTICEVTFNHLSGLKDHICLYTSEKGFTCDNCGARFTDMGQMTHHLQSHTAKPFSCGVCDAKFCYSASLDSHMEMHTADVLLRRFC